MPAKENYSNQFIKVYWMEFFGQILVVVSLKF
ncbi:hypothetical protein SAMN06272755_1911 [Picosynechococcus sp. OG1]|nr:hypothetical protein SAMN06272755_1911 [Picosynechococcus sp. OG1]SMQ81251.1 hypothetical protein SAMN06272774_1190 [Synechococcus sp. 7002]